MAKAPRSERKVKEKVDRRGGAPPPVARVWEFFETYTRDLRADDFQRVFTRETPEAWQMFAKAIKAEGKSAEDATRQISSEFAVKYPGWLRPGNMTRAVAQAYKEVP